MGIVWSETLARAVSFFFSSRRRHTRWNCDWSSDVCSSDLEVPRSRGQRDVDADEVGLGEQLVERRLGGVDEVHPKALRPGRDGMADAPEADDRSEERRVGKECRSGCSAGRLKKQSDAMGRM